MVLPRRLRIVRDDTDPTPAPQHRLLTIEIVAARLSVSRSTAYELARRGAIPTVKLAGSSLVRVSERALERLIAGQVAP